MARKCTLKACRSELPSKAKSDYWQAGGFCKVDCKALHGLALVAAQKERKRKADEAGIKKRNSEQKAKNVAFKKSVRKRTGKGGYYENLKTALHYCVKNIFRAGEPCYTCGQEQKSTDSNQSFHVGHFMPAKMVDPRRFMLENLRIQCYRCNVANSGRHSEYRLNLIDEKGIDHVEWLECSDNHRELKEQYPDIEDIRSETAKYNKLKIDHKKSIELC